MLATKKRFLDINRRAVSKRLKRLREKETKGNKIKHMLSSSRRGRR
jgi:hypothetical protein